MAPSRFAARVAHRLRPTKHSAELGYWLDRQRHEGTLRNDWYERAFTTHFELESGFYEGKRVLDIGCGPRGSLEWCDQAAERVGVDPLADRYRQLGTGRHHMRYIAAGAETIPVPDGSFDVVTSLNSLDHVDDVDAVIREITRVTAPRGTLLVTCEIGHEPTPTEPVSLTWDVLDRFAGFRVEWERRNGIRDKADLLGSIDADVPYVEDPGLLRARLTRS